MSPLSATQVTIITRDVYTAQNTSDTPEVNPINNIGSVELIPGETVLETTTTFDINNGSGITIFVDQGYFHNNYDTTLEGHLTDPSGHTLTFRQEGICFIGIRHSEGASDLLFVDSTEANSDNQFIFSCAPNVTAPLESFIGTDSYTAAAFETALRGVSLASMLGAETSLISPYGQPAGLYGDYQFDSSGTATIKVAPEPSTGLFGALSTAALLLLHRKRRVSNSWGGALRCHFPKPPTIDS